MGGGLEQAVAAYETALELLPATPCDSSSSSMAAQGMHYMGPSGSLSIAGSRSESDQIQLSLRLNLARALAKLSCAQPGEGGAAAAARAVALFKALEREGAMQSDATAWMAYAAVLKRQHLRAAAAGETRATEALEAALAVSAAPSPGGRDEAGSSVVRLLCALALCRQLVQTGNLDRAQVLVRDQAGTSLNSRSAAALAVQLWLALAAGCTAASPASGGVSEAAASAAATQTISWADANPGVVDGADVRAHLGAIRAAACAARGRQAQAATAAAAAVHACPWDPRWRLLLASAAAEASPTNGLAAARLAPSAASLVGEATAAPTLQSLSAIGPAAAAGPAKAPTMVGVITPLVTHPTTVSPAALPLQRPVLPSLRLRHEGDAHTLRASGLVATLPLAQLHASFSAEVGRLTRLLHSHPDSTATRFLLALVSVQLAASSQDDRRVGLYRQALGRCRAALERVRAQLKAQEQPQPQQAAQSPLAAMMNAAAAAAAKRPRPETVGVPIRILYCYFSCHRPLSNLTSPLPNRAAAAVGHGASAADRSQRVPLARRPARRGPRARSPGGSRCPGMGAAARAGAGACAATTRTCPMGAG